LTNSTEANAAVNKIIERESKEITTKADTLSPAVVSTEIKTEVVPVVEPVKPVSTDTSASVTGTSTSSSSTSATAGGTSVLTSTETKAPAATSTIVEVQTVAPSTTPTTSTAPTTPTTTVPATTTTPATTTPVVPTSTEIKDEDIVALVAKVDTLLKAPLPSSQLTEAKALNDQLMVMVTKLVNLGKSDKALLVLEASKKLLKAMEALVAPVVAPVSTSSTTVETSIVPVSTMDVTSTSVQTIPATTDTTVINQ
jgi:hypothetical protein